MDIEIQGGVNVSIFGDSKSMTIEMTLTSLKGEGNSVSRTLLYDKEISPKRVESWVTEMLWELKAQLVENIQLGLAKVEFTNRRSK